MCLTDMQTIFLCFSWPNIMTCLMSWSCLSKTLTFHLLIFIIILFFLFGDASAMWPKLWLTQSNGDVIGLFRCRMLQDSCRTESSQRWRIWGLLTRAEAPPSPVFTHLRYLWKLILWVCSQVASGQQMETNRFDCSRLQSPHRRAFPACFPNKSTYQPFITESSVCWLTSGQQSVRYDRPIMAWEEGRVIWKPKTGVWWNESI